MDFDKKKKKKDQSKDNQISFQLNDAYFLHRNIKRKHFRIKIKMCYLISFHLSLPIT